MDVLSSQNKIISQLRDFLCEAMDLLNNPLADLGGRTRHAPP